MNDNPLGKQISLLAKNIKAQIDHQLLKYQITMEQSRVLAYLMRISSQDDIYQKDLCAFFSSSKGSISTILTNLENHGFIERSIGSDARHRKIVITTKAQQIHKNIIQELNFFEKKLMTGLDEKEIIIFQEIIKKINFNLKGQNKND